MRKKKAGLPQISQVMVAKQAGNRGTTGGVERKEYGAEKGVGEFRGLRMYKENARAARNESGWLFPLGRSETGYIPT